MHQQSWPAFDEAAAREDVIEIPVQVNGKVRDRVTVPADATEGEIKAAAPAQTEKQRSKASTAQKFRRRRTQSGRS